MFVKEKKPVDYSSRKLNTNQINWNQKHEKRTIMDADDFM